MRLMLAAAFACAATVGAQQPAIERLRAIVTRDDRAALAGAVKEHPDDSRELVRRLLVEAGRREPGAADTPLAIAHRLAGAYAETWEDSFPLSQVTRFSGRPPEWRAAKVAADSVRRAGNDALGRAGVRPAMSLWRDALRRATAIHDTAGIGAALGNMGAGFYRDGMLDSAQHYLERARRVAESVGDRRTALNALGTLGSVARDRGDLRRAQEFYAQALDHRSKIGDARGSSADHNNLGLIAASLGETGEARTHYRQALAIAKQHGLDEAAAEALLNLGNAASLDADYPEAIALYGEALALYRSSGSEADAALVLHNLGLLELRRGSYQQAKARLGESLAIFARTGTAEDIVQVRRDLASVSAAAGDLQGAIGQLRRAEQLLGRMPPRPDLVAAVALARGDLAAHLNAYAEADRHYARAEAMYRRAGNAAGRAEAQQGRAQLLAEQQRHGAALQMLRSAARTQAVAGDRRPAALTTLLIGQTQLRQGDEAGARRTLAQARDSLHTLGDAVGEAAALGGSGDLELEAGSPLAAEALYRQGLSRLGSRAAASVSWQLHAGLARALRGRGALAPAAAELRAAISDLERAAGTLTLEERRATFLADKWDVYAELAMVEGQRGDASAAFAASERMRSRQTLALLARGRVTPPATADAELLGREQDLRRRIDELTQRLEVVDRSPEAQRGRDLVGSSSAVAREALSRSQEQYAQLLLEMRDAGAQATLARGALASWRDVAGRLLPGEALLEYLVADSASAVFVVTRDTMRIVDLGVGRRTLESLIDFVRGTLQRPNAATSVAGTRSAWRPPLHRLYGHLLAPIEAEGALEGIQRLIIVPHAELNYLPFAALIRRGERDEYLIERYDIGYAPSASVWVRLGERAGPAASPRSARAGEVLAVAPRVSTLPGSREEVASIGAMYGARATTLIGSAATESAFRAAAPRYDILHLATYGVLNRHNPLFSFVELNSGRESDGRLEVHEVLGLTLSARLVVLSACQTALGSGAVSDVPAGDDWVGLVRAFLAAGAANVIATLWAVEDRSTARMMERLHRRLRAGESEIAALASAQREMLRNPASSDPFYWAGFVLVGGH